MLNTPPTVQPFRVRWKSAHRMRAAITLDSSKYPTPNPSTLDQQMISNELPNYLNVLHSDSPSPLPFQTNHHIQPSTQILAQLNQLSQIRSTRPTTQILQKRFSAPLNFTPLATFCLQKPSLQSTTLDQPSASSILLDQQDQYKKQLIPITRHHPTPLTGRKDKFPDIFQARNRSISAGRTQSRTIDVFSNRHRSIDKLLQTFILPQQSKEVVPPSIHLSAEISQNQDFEGLYEQASLTNRLATDKRFPRQNQYPPQLLSTLKAKVLRNTQSLLNTHINPQKPNQLKATSLFPVYDHSSTRLQTPAFHNEEESDSNYENLLDEDFLSSHLSSHQSHVKEFLTFSLQCDRQTISIQQGLQTHINLMITVHIPALNEKRLIPNPIDMVFVIDASQVTSYDRVGVIIPTKHKGYYVIPLTRCQKALTIQLLDSLHIEQNEKLSIYSAISMALNVLSRRKQRNILTQIVIIAAEEINCDQLQITMKESINQCSVIVEIIQLERNTAKQSQAVEFSCFSASSMTSYTYCRNEMNLLKVICSKFKQLQQTLASSAEVLIKTLNKSKIQFIKLCGPSWPTEDPWRATIFRLVAGEPRTLCIGLILQCLEQDTRKCFSLQAFSASLIVNMLDNPLDSITPIQIAQTLSHNLTFRNSVRPLMNYINPTVINSVKHAGILRQCQSLIIKIAGVFADLFNQRTILRETQELTWQMCKKEGGMYQSVEKLLKERLEKFLHSPEAIEAADIYEIYSDLTEALRNCCS